VPTDNGLTGAEAARRILDAAGLTAMPVNEVPGHLTDHYDPVQKALFLSSDNFHGNSVAAVGVAAHEAGHALQHKAAYGPLHFRMAMVPLVGFASGGAWLAFFLGMILMGLRVVHPSIASNLMGVGVGLFSIITLFQLVTLPVEFDASRRAKQQLGAMGLVTREQLGGVSNVLGAAAMTYVAALASSVFELLRLILIMRSFDRGDDRS
jgi:Zn-dependent membrane protease YugP